MSSLLTITKSGIITEAPPFTDYDATLNPQQRSAERNGNGRLLRETLPDKWALKMEWSFGTPEESYDWFNYLKGLTRIDFVVNFPAPTGNIEQATFYISPISAKMLSLNFGTSGWWKTIKCTFVEV